MIVREIAKNPELLDDFDWFNDYKDTRQWAVFAERPDLVKRLDEGHKQWLEQRIRGVEMKKVTANDVKNLFRMTEESIMDSVSRVEEVLVEWAAKFYNGNAPSDFDELDDWLNDRWQEIGLAKWHEELADMFNYNQWVNDGFWANHDYMKGEFEEAERYNEGV